MKYKHFIGREDLLVNTVSPKNYTLPLFYCEQSYHCHFLKKNSWIYFIYRYGYRYVYMCVYSFIYI